VLVQRIWLDCFHVSVWDVIPWTTAVCPALSSFLHPFQSLRIPSIIADKRRFCPQTIST
jgi:hypothetical protein